MAKLTLDDGSEIEISQSLVRLMCEHYGVVLDWLVEFDLFYEDKNKNLACGPSEDATFNVDAKNKLLKLRKDVGKLITVLEKDKYDVPLTPVPPKENGNSD